jgi:opacity protein-like surface antigen
MKKLFVAFIAITFITTTVNAQGGTNFSIGLEGTVPMGKFNDLGYKLGIGGSLQVDHKVASDMALTLNAGYITHNNKNSTPTYRFNVIPLLGGIKYWFSPKVYGSAQLGAAFNSVKVNNTSGNSTSTGFAYSPGIGFNVANSIDILVKYFGNSVDNVAFSSIGARIAYTFGK